MYEHSLRMFCIYRVACSEDQRLYKCPNTGRCIKASYVCDGNNQCGDWSEELNCRK